VTNGEGVADESGGVVGRGETVADELGESSTLGVMVWRSGAKLRWVGRAVWQAVREVDTNKSTSRRR
jgi:hypothetical protein